MRFACRFAGCGGRSVKGPLDVRYRGMYNSCVNNTDGRPGDDVAVADTTIFSVIHAAHALEDKLDEALEKAQLSMPKYSVLNELVSSGQALSLGELASRLSCVRSNMTQLVDRLE